MKDKMAWFFHEGTDLILRFYKPVLSVAFLLVLILAGALATAEVRSGGQGHYQGQGGNYGRHDGNYTRQGGNYGSHGGSYTRHGGNYGSHGGSYTRHSGNYGSHGRSYTRHGGHHSYSHFGIGFNYYGPFWGASWRYWDPYPYNHAPYYPYSYYYAPEVRMQSPPVYIERSVPPEGTAPPAVWYYCPESQTYYPYVQECSGGWEKVPAQPLEPQR